MILFILPYIEDFNAFCQKMYKKGGHRCRFKISELKNLNFASISTRRYNDVLWKTHFFGTSLLHKSLRSAKTSHIFFFKNLHSTAR